MIFSIVYDPVTVGIKVDGKDLKLKYTMRFSSCFAHESFPLRHIYVYVGSSTSIDYGLQTLF